MRRPPRDPNLKVPVFKNIAYALKIVWQCDKKLLIGYLINHFATNIFALYIQNILFLKVLLGILDSGKDFRSYANTLITFLLCALTLRATSWFTNYIISVAAKNVLKELNNKIFDKAITLDVECYENPEFYDKYQRATNVLAWSYFDFVCSSVAGIVSCVVSLALVIGTVSTINPKYLIFLLPVVLVFVIEDRKSTRLNSSHVT